MTLRQSIKKRLHNTGHLRVIVDLFELEESLERVHNHKRSVIPVDQLEKPFSRVARHATNMQKDMIIRSNTKLRKDFSKITLAHIEEYIEYGSFFGSSVKEREAHARRPTRG